MEPAFHCAYNVTRRIALSERLITLASPGLPAQLLAVVLNGPGRDRSAAVWLTRPERAIEMPRLFAFDVAYLDDQQKIVKTAAVGPATPFPPLDDVVASILFLPDHCLESSKTVSGDNVKICSEAELQSLRDLTRSEPVETPGPSSGTFVPPDSGETFTAQVEPRFSELFSASLLYMPSSGSPVASEFFLPREAERALKPTDSSQEKIEAEQLAVPGPAEQESIPPQDRVPEQDANPKPDRPLLAPPELPPSLRALLHGVDEKIRREDKDLEKDQAVPQYRHEEEGRPTETFAPENLQQPSISRPQMNSRDLPGERGVIPISRSSETASEIKKASSSDRRREAIAAPQTSPDKFQAQALPAFTKRSQPFQNSLDTEISEDIGSTRKSTKWSSPAYSPPGEDVEPAANPKEDLSFGARVKRWLSGESSSLSGNRRRGNRFSPPGLVAFYWTGGPPTPHQIVNISTSGLYLRSKELWSPDTLVRMTLERQHAEWEQPETISVLARVVRRDDGGVAHEFIMTEVLENLRVRDFLPEHGTDRKDLERFLALH